MLVVDASRYMPLIVLRLVFITQSYESPDRTYNDFKVVVATQVGMNVSIILACVPFLKPLLDNLHPGWSTSDVRTGLGYNSMADSIARRNYAIGSVVKSANQSKIGQRSATRPQWVKTGMKHSHTVTATGDPAESRPNSGNSDKMMIQHTTGYTVQSEQWPPS